MNFGRGLLYREQFFAAVLTTTDLPIFTDMISFLNVFFYFPENIFICPWNLILKESDRLSLLRAMSFYNDRDAVLQYKTDNVCVDFKAI